MTRAVAIAAVWVIAVVARARAETRPSYTGKLDGTLLGAPATFDPAAAQSHAEITLAELLFDTLYRLEPAATGYQAVPHLAIAMPELNASKTVARIAIRKHVEFHDGTPLTAKDVALSLERARSGPGRWALASIAAVKATGHTVEITLRQTESDLATMLALAPAAVTPGGKPPAAKPVGSGPYRLDALDRTNRRLVLVAFEGHFAGRPYVDQLVLRWHSQPDAEAKRFELDESQVSARGPSAFANGQPKYRSNFVDGPRTVLVFVGFGGKHPQVTGDRDFRRALDLALDRNALATVQHGEAIAPTNEPLPSEAGGAALPAAAKFGDVTQARSALAAAATRVPALATANLPQLVLEIGFEETRPDDRELAERVARALGKLSITATLTALSATDLRERAANGALDLWIGQLAAPLTTSWAWWASAFAAGGDGWAATTLANGALTTAAARSEFTARRPIVPLVFRGIRLWHRSDIRGVRFDAFGRACWADLFVFGHPIKTQVTP